MFLRVDTIFLPVTDVELARDFYAMKVGLPELYLDDEFAGFAIGETSIAFVVNEEIDDHSNISVVVEDLEASVNELEERGVLVRGIDGPVTAIDVVTFDDPFGNQWTLVQE